MIRFLLGCALLLVTLVHPRGAVLAKTSCSAPPLPIVATDRSAYRSETISQGTFIDTIVRGLIPRVARAKHVDSRYGSWFAACESHAKMGSVQLLQGVRRLGFNPQTAAVAYLAAVQYPGRMWGGYGWGHFIAAVVNRGQVDDIPAWIFILVGPQSMNWRYAVVRDSGEVLAWELTGADAQRLFHTGASGGGHQ